MNKCKVGTILGFSKGQKPILESINRFYFRILDLLDAARFGKQKHTEVDLDELYAQSKNLREQLKQEFYCNTGNTMEFYSQLIATGYIPEDDFGMYLNLIQDLKVLNSADSLLRALSLNDF